MKIKKSLPELLAPAGSYDAFEAAIGAGADAVYLGAGSHNARIGAQNFKGELLHTALRDAKIYDKKVYITLNTLAYDRELEEITELVYDLLCHGADAFIVQDMGVASSLLKIFPDIHLHASTQTAAHNLNIAKRFHRLGFKRMVAARELHVEQLRLLCEGDIEIEMFVHGALCVCHSGMCLFSSIVGGRSGNRGLCAQPCRMLYRDGKKEGYLLSLKDLCLAPHIPQIIDFSPASLKIEGRMKSASYVSAVVALYRKLLDERRAATDDEIKELSEVFSRGGFTDGYFTGERKKMFGFRSDADKAATRQAARAIQVKTPQKPSLDFLLNVNEGNMTLCASFEKKQYVSQTKRADPPLTRAADETSVTSQLSRLGDTPFTLGKVKYISDGDYYIPASTLNAMRRETVEGILNSISNFEVKRLQPEKTAGENVCLPMSFRFVFEEHLPGLDIEKLLTYAKEKEMTVSEVWLSPAYGKTKYGTLCPAVIKDGESSDMSDSLLVDNMGAPFDGAKRVCGGIGLNVTNSAAVKFYADMGMKSVTLSPEVPLPAVRHIKKYVPCAYHVYGHLPVMTTEAPIESKILSDRKSKRFAVLSDFFGRKRIYNSAPTYLGDKMKEVSEAGISVAELRFTVESIERIYKIIDLISASLPFDGEFTRK